MRYDCNTQYGDNIILEENAGVKECDFFPYWGFKVKVLFKECV